MADGQELVARWRSSKVAGDCNACTDRTSSVVCEINFRSNYIRLCPRCKSDLIMLFSKMGSWSKNLN